MRRFIFSRNCQYCYNAAISACGKSGQWHRAKELLSTMREKGVPPDLISYNSAIDACGKGGRFVLLYFLHASTRLFFFFSVNVVFSVVGCRLSFFFSRRICTRQAHHPPYPSIPSMVCFYVGRGGERETEEAFLFCLRSRNAEIWVKHELNFQAGYLYKYRRPGPPATSPSSSWCRHRT